MSSNEDYLRRFIDRFKSEGLIAVALPGCEIRISNQRLDRISSQIKEDTIRRSVIDFAVSAQASRELTLQLKTVGSSEFREFAATDDCQVKLKKIACWQNYILVSVNVEDPSYADLYRELQTVSFLAESCPLGVGLIRARFTSGETSGPYCTQRFAELFRVTKADIERRGILALSSNAQLADQTVFDPLIIEAIKKRDPYCMVVMRISDGESQSHWIREQVFQSFAGDGVTGYGAGLVENFDQGAKAIIDRLRRYRSNLMLESFSLSVFDCCLFLDERLRIAWDTPAVRACCFNDTSRPIMGTPFELFIALDHSKLKFRSYLSSVESSKPIPSRSERLKMNLGRKHMVDVEVFAAAIKSGYGSSDSGGSDRGSTAGLSFISSQGSSKSVGRRAFLIGLRFLTRKARPVPLHQQSSSPATLSVPPRRRESFLSDSEKAQARNQRGIATHAMFRWLLRDLSVSIKEMPLMQNFEWLIPTHIVSFQDEVREDLVRALPNNLQSEFMESVIGADYNNCAQLLSYAVEGNANILSAYSPRSGGIIDDPDLIHCAFRLFISLLPRMTSFAKIYALLCSLNDSRRAIVRRRLDVAGSVFLLYEFALAILSTGIRSPEIFSNETALNWLREVFTEALRAPDVEYIDPGRKLIAVYWICILWGCLMQILGRPDEAIGTLKNLQQDIHQYCERHPGATMARELQCVTLYNICVSCMQNGHDVSVWTEQLESATQWVPPSPLKRVISVMLHNSRTFQ